MKHPPDPGPIPTVAVEQFRTLKSACGLGLLALVRSVRKSDGRPVTLLCKIEPVTDDLTHFCLLGEIVETAEGGVWEQYINPEEFLPTKPENQHGETDDEG